MSRPGFARRRAFLSALLGLGLLLASGASFAEDSDKDDDDSLADKAADRFPQPVPVGTLLNRTVLEPLESQPILGHVREIVRAADGSIKVVVAYGGFLGFGARPIGVPVEAMALLGEYMEIVAFKPAQLDAFPAFDPAGTTKLAADDIIKVGLAKPSH
jgi:hypothetical protein